ncbi:MAG: ligase-associated DNA damage response endonuclease PdeM [Pseudomonadota bacterium]
MWWPDQRVLVVSDLHLGKSGRIARRTGTLVPPYETHDTLMRLQADILTNNPATVICLGDSFDDMLASKTLAADDRDGLLKMQKGRDWIWIEGNHDPAPVTLAGQHRSHMTIGSLTFRHIAATDCLGEVSGHYHPKLSLSVRGRHIQRACFLYDHHRLILPAYGTYTGGLDVQAPVLQNIMAPTALAILVGSGGHMMPMPRLTSVL